MQRSTEGARAPAAPAASSSGNRVCSLAAHQGHRLPYYLDVSSITLAQIHLPRCNLQYDVISCLDAIDGAPAREAAIHDLPRPPRLRYLERIRAENDHRRTQPVTCRSRRRNLSTISTDRHRCTVSKVLRRHYGRPADEARHIERDGPVIEILGRP